MTDAAETPTPDPELDEEEEDGLLDDELAYHALHCHWCGEEIKRFYIEPSDSVIPEVDGAYVCPDCGNETKITSVAATLDVGAAQGRNQEMIKFERETSQAKYRDAITNLRRDWTKIKSRFSIWCSISGHTWTIVARGVNEYGQTSYDGVKNTMAYCRVCDHRHDNLVGDIAWVTGVD